MAEGEGTASSGWWVRARVGRSIAEGPDVGLGEAAGRGIALGEDTERDVDPPSDRRWNRAVGLAIVGFILLVYLVSNPNRHNFYEHFTWQASAWLEGQAGIRYPVAATPDSPGNDYFLDVLPLADANGNLTGRALIPFPPFPAVVLLPFVAIWGLTTNAQLIASLIGGLDVWLAWWVLGALGLTHRIRAAVTVFFGLGTVFWYTAMLGTTWYLAHVVAVGLTLGAVGVALRADPGAVAGAVFGTVTRAGGGPTGLAVRSGWRDLTAGLQGLWPRRSLRGAAEQAGGPDPSLRDGPPPLPSGPLGLLDGRQFLAGFLLGLAATARLTVVLGLPFLAFVGGGGTPIRRTLSAGLGAALPTLALVAYNIATTGHVFHPAYDYLYHVEANGYPELGYHSDWSIEDIRYIPQNLMLMLAGPPDVLPPCDPGATRSLFSVDCTIVVPRAIGMSVLLTSPAYLLAIPALLRAWRSRLVAGAVLAIVAIAVVNLMHFSQGWVQFGYRFASDFAPFALLLVGLGVAGLGRIRGWAGALILASVLVNFWGVVWGVLLQW